MLVPLAAVPSSPTLQSDTRIESSNGPSIKEDFFNNIRGERILVDRPYTAAQFSYCCYSCILQHFVGSNVGQRDVTGLLLSGAPHVTEKSVKLPLSASIQNIAALPSRGKYSPRNFMNLRTLGSW